jgi:FMN phosphatase YigB (HAD superfamily)
MTPKAVVFDLGKVLVDFDYGIAARTLAARARVSAEEVKRLIDQSQLLVSYETGQLATEAFYKQVCDGTGFCGDLQEFGRLFGDIFTAIEPMIELHAQLRQNAVPTYIFSNTNELAVAHIRKAFPFFSTFDGYIFSFAERAMKPDEKIYAAVERHTGLTGPEILYIDDRLENAEAGKRRAWQIIHHHDPSTTRKAVAITNLLQRSGL